MAAGPKEQPLKITRAQKRIIKPTRRTAFMTRPRSEMRGTLPRHSVIDRGRGQTLSVVGIVRAGRLKKGVGFRCAKHPSGRSGNETRPLFLAALSRARTGPGAAGGSRYRLAP